MRLSCCVPFCHRTRGDRKGDPLRPGMEWLCGDQWRLCDKNYRRAYGRHRRKWRRFSPKQRDVLMWVVMDRLWRRLKRQAIERAMGIGAAARHRRAKVRKRYSGRVRSGIA